MIQVKFNTDHPPADGHLCFIYQGSELCIPAQLTSEKKQVASSYKQCRTVHQRRVSKLMQQPGIASSFERLWQSWTKQVPKARHSLPLWTLNFLVNIWEFTYKSDYLYNLFSGSCARTVGSHGICLRRWLFHCRCVLSFVGTRPAAHSI